MPAPDKTPNIFKSGLNLSLIISIFVVAYFVFQVVWGLINDARTYYAYSVAFACVLALGVVVYVLRQSTDRKKTLLLSLVSVLFCISLVEGFFMLSVPSKVASFLKYGVTYDSRNKLEVLSDYRDAGIVAYPSVPPYLLFSMVRDDSIFRDGGNVMPLAGISNSITVYCNEIGEWTIYESDEHGFNNEKGLYAVGGLDFALIGDSFIHGACVREGDDLASKVRQKGYKGLALGQSGNGPLLELATLMEYAAPFKPRNIFWFYFEGNDIENFTIEKRSDILRAYMDGDYSQSLIERQEAIDRLLIRYINKNHKELEAWLGLQKKDDALYKFITFTHIQNRLAGFMNKKDPLKEEEYVDLSDNRDIEGIKAVLDKADDMVASWGGEMFFVYLPTWSRYYFNREDSAYDRRKMLEAVASLGIPVIDVSVEFRKVSNPLSLFPYERHGHYLPEGYEIISRAITKSMEEQ